MKQLVCVVLLAIGCHKDPGGGSAGAGSQAAGSPNAGSPNAGSPNAGSPNAGSGPGSANTGSAGTAPPASEASKSVEDFDRWLAPIWKLPGSDRLAPLCTSLKTLQGKAAAIQQLPAPAGAAADRWRDETARLATTMGTLDLCCSTHDETCINDVHEVLAAVIALVPGARPIDSHKDDPVMASAGAAGGMAAPADAGKARAAAHTAEAALAAAVASKATAPAALCKAGYDAVEAVETALNAPGLAVPAAAEAAWRDQLGALLMNAGAFDGQYCAPGKPADAAAIKDALVALHDHAKQLEAVAAKPN
jgi:hypothetical protein